MLDSALNDRRLLSAGNTLAGRICALYCVLCCQAAQTVSTDEGNVPVEQPRYLAVLRSAGGRLGSVQ